jgi:ferritin-like metal-binding protein YciE
MSTSATEKVLQYLNEAYATERALVRVLQSQIAMTPRGPYRDALETHLRETRGHAERVQRRRAALGGDGSSPAQAVFGIVEHLAGQVIALSKTPFDLLRGTGGEEKILKNAKDSYAAEALEIATYTALERLARGVGDTETAELAASIRADEERMRDRILEQLPELTDAVVRAEIGGEPLFDASKTGAADAVRAAGKAAQRSAASVPGAVRERATTGEEDLPIARYDSLTAEEIVERLRGLTQVELGTVDAYERRHQDRSTVRDRIASLRGDEPLPGYDELTAAEVQAALADADEDLARSIRDYERAHKDRVSVLRAVDRELAKA